MCCLMLHAFYPTTGEISIVLSLIIPTSPATFRRAALWNFLASRVKNRSGMIAKFKNMWRDVERNWYQHQVLHISHLYVYIYMFMCMCMYIYMYIYTIKSHYQYGNMMMLRYGTGIIRVSYIHMAIVYLTRRPILQEPNASKIVKLSQRKHTTKIKGKSWENQGKIGKSLIRHGTHAVSCSIYEILLAFLRVLPTRSPARNHAVLPRHMTLELLGAPCNANTRSFLLKALTGRYGIISINHVEFY